MSNVEKFEFYQPNAGSDPAHTGTGASAIAEATPALTPLMLDATNGVLVAWDGQNAGAAVGLLAMNIKGGEATIPYFKSGTWRMEDIQWPADVSDTLKRNAFIGSALSVA